MKNLLGLLAGLCVCLIVFVYLFEVMNRWDASPCGRPTLSVDQDWFDWNLKTIVSDF